jgi:glycosyltransferase involved in cell wall biosynthesis
VTTVVPTRDRPEMLRQAVASILGQDYQGDVECIVVFDRSEPRPPEAPTSGTHRTLRCITNERTPGLAGARNTGALAAGGELLAFCDDDDEWEPDKLRRQVETLASRAEAEVVASGIAVRYEDRTVERVPTMDTVRFEDLLRSRIVELHPSSVVVRRNAFLDGIGMVDEAIPGSYGEDYEWLLRAARRSPVAVVRRPLVRVRWGPSSWFAGRWQMMADALSYLLDRYPEFRSEPRGYARIAGQVAFANAGAGRREPARSWAWRSLVASRGRERRAWLALAVSLRIVSAERVLGILNARGRGI